MYDMYIRIIMGKEENILNKDLLINRQKCECINDFSCGRFFSSKFISLYM